ncbi:hypothetical protein [Aestuariivivens sp. NBU2969]|uniref:hypothetical protein n=1 Tax=Aestuariivivens sp. NBU2969 TaxID=2873267 RepID=UPI001CBC2E34|nr:hypothetical protein [Aestuariivivens sp. NBU2969]
MILRDKQSLLLCGTLAAGLFVCGVFNMLDNFVVLTLLVLIYLLIVVNIVYTKSKYPEEDMDSNTPEKNS